MNIAAKVGPALALEVADAAVTIHPSYLLRIRDEAEQRRQRWEFVSDLHKVVEFRSR